MARRDPDHTRLLELSRLLSRARRGARDWSADELLELPRLYRLACSVVARLEASGANPSLARRARHLVAEAHALLYRRRQSRARSGLRAALELFFVDSPRAIRAEWRMLLLNFGLVYGLALLAGLAVSRDLDLAFSLMSPELVETQISQLRETPAGEAFRGNFDFGLGESPTTAGWIMMHNMGVGVLFFASALVPPLYLLLLALNALMLGTYTAVAWHWGQAGAISSILWCHGAIEIQTLVLSATAGLCLVRAWIRPGPWTRRHAMSVESRKALRLLAPVFPLLFLAGMIEGFVSPHAPPAVRIAVALGSGLALLAWALLGGRSATGDGADQLPMRSSSASVSP